MKKIIYVGTTVGVLAFGGIVFANTDSERTTSKLPTAEASQNLMSINEEVLSFEEASKIALGIADGEITDIELNSNKNNRYYEVDIYHDGYEYDLKLDALSGEVLQQKREKDDRDDEAENALPADGLISSEEAVKAARTVAKGTVTEVKLDDDDGSARYEIEFKDGKAEHEVSVDAVNGSVLEHESDKDDNDDDEDDDKDDDSEDDNGDD